FVSGSYQGITVLGDTCYSSNLPKTSMHGAGNVRFADIDANGTNDMFYGDLFSHGIFFMENTGTPTVPHLTCASNRYPPDGSLVTAGFNEPVFVDIDGDGKLDLFVAVQNNAGRHAFWYYENAGTPSVADYRLRTKDFISNLDGGNNPPAAFVDIDGDGDADLYVGSLEGSLWFFRNTGTSQSPSFTLVDTVTAGVSGGFNYAPAFVDIDGDGDKDLFIGRLDG